MPLHYNMHHATKKSTVSDENYYKAMGFLRAYIMLRNAILTGSAEMLYFDSTNPPQYPEAYILPGPDGGMILQDFNNFIGRGKK